MTEDIFYEYLFTVILPFYPKCKKGKVVRDKKGNIVHSPVIVKVDTGPGRLEKHLTSVEKRRKAWELGLIILLGLPNFTSVSQELDWLFRLFKALCRQATLDLYAAKIKERAEKKKCGELNDVVQVVNLTNEDLPLIVNGRPTDPIKLQPFDCCFTKESETSFLRDWLCATHATDA